MLVLISWLVVRMGIVLARTNCRKVSGYPTSTENTYDLYRFDSIYYRSIADWGYVYDGNPANSSNVVFAPLFRCLCRRWPQSRAGTSS